MTPNLKDVRRWAHTQNERQRRSELQRNFLSLKTVLNIEESKKLSKHDLLNEVSNLHLDLTILVLLSSFNF